uniref:Gustatory receptor n=1 Tax=Tetranychus urticae TaxID=32264 RepID=T1KJ72_TETUR
MTSINMQQCFVRNEELKHYPKVSIDSIQSKFQLMISSTSHIYGKCLFVLIMFLFNLYYFRELLYFSLDAIFSFTFESFIRLLYGNGIDMVFYFKYNHKLMKTIDDDWNGLQIDFDYETRKYFWTHKAKCRRLINVVSIFYLIITCFYPISLYNTQQRIKLVQHIIYYFCLLVCFPLYQYKRFCHCCIYVDLILLAQTAVQFNLIKLQKLLNETRKDEKSLNINVIENARNKYLLSCRLIDKMNDIMSPCLFFIFTNFAVNAGHLFYNLLYTKEDEAGKLITNFQLSCSLTLVLLYTHLSLKIHEKSLESLATVYKLSLKTNSIRLLNEISLFLNHNEIGFTFGGMFMLTTSSLSTLFSIIVTIVFALPTFAR